MKKYLVTTAVLSALLCFADETAKQASEIGKSLGSDLSGFFENNMDSMGKAIQNEGTISSVDGKSTGDASMVCGKKGDFLRLSYNGSGNVNLKVEIDDDLDGKWDRNFNFSDISGVCANGVKRSWIEYSICHKNESGWGSAWKNQCKGGIFLKNENGFNYYKMPLAKTNFFLWRYDGSNLTLKQTQEASDLGACYCIGSECGNVSNTQKSKILQDFGAPISTLISNGNSFVISNAFMDGSTLKYTAQDMSSCSNATARGSSYQAVDKEGNTTEQANRQIEQQKNDELSVWSIFEAGSKNKDSDLDLQFENNLEKQVQNLQKSASFNLSNNQLSYTDKNGTRITADMNLGDTNIKSEFCEVRVLESDTAIYNDGSNKAQATTSATTYTTDIRQCKNGSCPVKSGESIKHQCGKVSDMGNALAILSVVEEMNKDSKCVK